MDAIQSMKKTLRRSKPKRRSHASVPARRQAVTRREYAELVVRLGSAELQMQRNRASIDSQAQLIRQLQDQLNALAIAQSPQAVSVSGDNPALPIAVATPTVES